MPSLSDKAYQRIKRAIVTLEMTPGSVIDESELMEQLGMGRTPIREALQRLAREDLVTILPRRGMFVSEIRAQDLRQIFEGRLPLDVACARLAAARAGEEVVVAMEALVEQIPEACATNSGRGLIHIDQQLHDLLLQGCNSKFLADGASWLYALSLRFWYLAADRMGNMVGSVQEHTALVDAIKRGDPESAEAAIRRHMAGFLTRVREVL